MTTNEAFSRVRIDAQLRDQGWDVLDINAVRFEYVLPDGTRADYVLCDRNGRALAVIEAKKASINPAEAQAQAKGYAGQLKVRADSMATRWKKSFRALGTRTHQRRLQVKSTPSPCASMANSYINHSNCSHAPESNVMPRK